MKLSDIKNELVFELMIKPEYSDEVIQPGTGTLHADPSRAECYQLYFGGVMQQVMVETRGAASELNTHLRRGCACLAHIDLAQIFPGGRAARLTVRFFNGEAVDWGDIEIGLDEHILNSAKKSGMRCKNIDELARLMEQKYQLQINGEGWFVFTSGPAARTELASEPVAKDAPPQQAFMLHGERQRLAVERRQQDFTTDILLASKAIASDNPRPNGALRLAKGRLMFTDHTQTGRLRAQAAGAMQKLSQQEDSYLKSWDQYGDIEGEMLLTRARAVGRIDFRWPPVPVSGGMKFSVSSLPEALTENDRLELTDEEPFYLRHPEASWQDYARHLEEQLAERQFSSGSQPLKIINLSAFSISLELQVEPAEGKFLTLSIGGDKTQIERRMQSRKAIIEGRSANPLLGLLIEENGTLPPLRYSSSLKPLTPFVEDKIFRHKPTDKQIKAIDVALNTPDIALIQGPPGTGKTTVVTAIIERLNEEFDKTRSMRGQILVSGFQHDAVENIIARLSINALPAVKFGKRSGDNGYGADAVTVRTEAWCANIAKRIREKNPQIVQTEHQRKLCELTAIYARTPSRSNTLALLNNILQLPRRLITPQIVDAARAILGSLQAESASLSFHSQRSVRALRVSPEGFADDGPTGALVLLETLGEQLTTEDRALLERAAFWRTGEPLDFLAALKMLKERLLLSARGLPDYRRDKTLESVTELVAEVQFCLKSELSGSSKRDAILAEFLHQLEDNPDGVLTAIEDYNFVFAATTQQADGRDIRKAKKRSDDERLTYDTVIIDEAARTSPRDLLIPMSQAEKRIILVGDHRQLPHIVNEDIVNMLGETQTSENDYVRESMFSYLKRRLTRLDAEQDYTRGRVVTLDAQYRTHPLLGKFVSEHFYEQHKEGYKSPLSARYFQQQLPGLQGKAMAWIDVPHRQGKATRLPTGSYTRDCEALKIAQQLADWLRCEEASAEYMSALTGAPHPGLSFGVITFYRAQVNALHEALQSLGISSFVNGEWQINDEWRFYSNDEERVRIGTVDSFQGMEFDVVLLSMVRSEDMHHLPDFIRKEANPRKQQQKIFGHLMSENRLCVSMSRQKRVLAIVGDSGTVRSAHGEAAVPALRNYYQLCQTEGVVL